MGTFPHSITVGSTLDLLDPGARAQPTPSERLQSFVLQRTLEGDPPGIWGGNRFEETNHFRGVVSIAIKAYMDAIGGAKFNVLRRKEPATDGVITKSFGVGNYSRDDEYEPADPDHPLCKVVEQPGGDDGVWGMAQECTYLTLQHMLTGDAPAWTPLNDQGKPVRFFGLTSALTQPLFSSGQDVRYPQGAYRVTPFQGGGAFYVAGARATSAVLPGEEVKRFREYHPWSRNAGYSRLAAGAKEVDVLEAIMESRWSMFDHGMQLDVALLIPGVGADEAAAMQKVAETKHGGSKNARRFMVLGGGALSDKAVFQNFGQSAREMDYTTSFDQQGGLVLAFFRVPKGVAGLTSQTSYSQHYAELQQFWDLGISPYCRALGVFLTQSLARPWCKFPGEYVIEVEANKPADLEMEAKRNDTGLQSGALDVNEWRKANGFKSKPDADLPIQVYLAKQQQAVAPAPVPGAMPGDVGATAPEGGDQLGAEGDDSPEATQDAVTAAALASLGVPAEDAEDATVAKAERQTRNEGERWQSGGKWWTKRNGKIVPAPTPGANAEGRYPSKHNPAITYGSKGDRNSDDRHHDKTIAAAKQEENAVRGQLADAEGKHAASQQRHDEAMQHVEALRKQLADAEAKAKQARAAAEPQQQASPDREQLHEAIVKTKGARAFGFTTENLAKLPETAVKMIAAQLGIIPAEQAVAPHAANVPAQTPTAKDTLTRAQEWAGQMADKHADRVSQHLGISREAAKRILAKAITQVAEHALKNGGTASGTLSVGGKQLKLGVKQKQPQGGSTPTGGAVPKPANAAAKGSLPPRVGKAMDAMSEPTGSTGGFLVPPETTARRRRKRGKACLARMMKSLEG